MPAQVVYPLLHPSGALFTLACRTLFNLRGTSVLSAYRAYIELPDGTFRESCHVQNNGPNASISAPFTEAIQLPASAAVKLANLG